MNEIIRHPMLSESKQNVFISYAWEGDEHEAWIKTLAEKITNAGGNPLLDHYLKFGSSLRLFMDMNIKAADVVLMIMTPQYKLKAEVLNGGVGYEFNIITKDLFKNIHKNEKYIGVLRNGDHETSVPEFCDDFKYVDLRPGDKYKINVDKLLAQILSIPLKHPEKTPKTKNMGIHYEKSEELIRNMQNKSYDYFQKLFGLENDSVQYKKLADDLPKWESEIQDYRDKFRTAFNPEKMEIYKRWKEDFKSKVFRKLWTVGAALQTPDPDLAAYKGNFRDADENEIYNTVNDILNASHLYVENFASKLDYFNLADKEDLGMQYLDGEDMSMKQIIGFGIRSELLHRYYPQHFPIMTQKNLWAMYFICESASEFIKIEQKIRAGQMRVSHNWQYPYDRFTFLMNELANQLHAWITGYGLRWEEQFRFGYVNLFLAHVHKTHDADIKLLHQWA